MTILITHGYLLTGTGSNLYVYNLVKAWCQSGHDVLLLCQEYHPEEIDFINEIYSFKDDNQALVLEETKETGYPGKCRFFKPDLDGLLPVYVYDEYPNFRVKTFNNCTLQEVERYVELNLNALNAILSQFEADVLQTNHAVMFPFIASLAQKEIPKYATIHGSALNFTVKKDERFVPFCVKGLEAAQKIFVDSQHAYHELVEFLESHKEEQLVKRVEIIPAGVDVSRFVLPEKSKNDLAQAYLELIQTKAANSAGRTSETTAELMANNLPEHPDELQLRVQNVRGSYDYRDIDRDVVQKIQRINWDEPVILYVGKYLWTKGIYLLVMAMPFILNKFPKAQLVLVGFGPFREVAEVMINYLERGKTEELQQLLKQKHELFESEEGNMLPLLEEFLEQHGEALQRALKAPDAAPGWLSDQIIFTGIADHNELTKLLPAADVLVAASVFPEAFGMVAIEAMAAGVYPVVTYQSAFAEIDDQKKQITDQYGIATEKVALAPDAPLKIAQNTINYIEFKSKNKSETVKQLQHHMRQLVLEQYSWQGIAEKYLEEYG